MAPYVSAIWGYFTKDVRDDEKKSATCNACGKRLMMSMSSTSALRSHLKAKHANDYLKFLDQEKEARDDYSNLNKTVDAAEAMHGKSSKGEIFV
jgi:hypothetical protein